MTPPMTAARAFSDHPVNASDGLLLDAFHTLVDGFQLFGHDVLRECQLLHGQGKGLHRLNELCLLINPAQSPFQPLVHDFHPRVHLLKSFGEVGVIVRHFRASFHPELQAIIRKSPRTPRLDTPWRASQPHLC